MRTSARVAVVGTGWWATATHIPALCADPHADLTALCDADAERVAAAARAFGVKHTYTDHRAMLEAERPNAVVVATTHATHFAVARDCLGAGAHVLIEKPMTLWADHARLLTELAAQRELSLIVGYPWNYTPHARRVRELVTSGALGPVQYVNCVFNSYNADLIAGKDRSDRPAAYPVHGPGAVYSKKEHSGGGHGHLQITHAAGLLFFCTGLQIRRVQARMANHDRPLDLVDAILVEFAEGGLGTVGGTSNAFLPQMNLSIGCAGGSVAMNMHAGTAHIRFADGAQETAGPAEEVYPRFAPVANLVAAARGAEAPIASAEAGWRAVELLDAAYRSAEADGRSMSLEELYRSDQA